MNIWIAASDGRIDLVKDFLSKGQTANDKDPNGYTPIHAAASYGHVELLKTLVNEYSGDVNIRDEDGDTPLHHCEDLTTAKFLIEELGADFNLTNDENKTCLQAWEEESENPDLIQYLRVKSGIPDQEDAFGIDREQMSQFKENIRYTLENDPVDASNPEAMARRQRLEQIIQSENAEEELEKYIREMLHQQFFSEQSDSDPNVSSKRKR